MPQDCQCRLLHHSLILISSKADVNEQYKWQYREGVPSVQRWIHLPFAVRFEVKSFTGLIALNYDMD
jgi:hypothetical protein